MFFMLANGFVRGIQTGTSKLLKIHIHTYLFFVFAICLQQTVIYFTILGNGNY